MLVEKTLVRIVAAVSMPLPDPSDYTDEDEFIQDCMADDTMNTEFRDDSQRRAVCQNLWDRRNE